MLWVVLVNKSDRNAHYAIVVIRDVRSLINIDGIVVVVVDVIFTPLDILMAAESQVFGHGHQRQRLMAAAMIEIGEPTAISEFDKSCCFIIDTSGIITLADGSEIGISTFESITHPHFIILYQREHLFVADGIHIPDNQELFIN